MGIQPVQAAEKAFTAKTAAPGQIEMADGTTSCRVWIGPQEGFDGTFAFVLREGGKVTAVGLSGKRLDSEAGRLDLPEGGQVILRVSAGGWTAEGDPPTRWTLR